MLALLHLGVKNIHLGPTLPAFLSHTIVKVLVENFNIGRITNIDELPQLINVLKGNMSVVGNRPIPLYEAEMLTTDQWALRFLAPAGITGLWQVNLGGKNIIAEEERKALDNKYAINSSFWKDILIIIKTIPVVFRKDNI